MKCRRPVPGGAGRPAVRLGWPVPILGAICADGRLARLPRCTLTRHGTSTPTWPLASAASSPTSAAMPNDRVLPSAAIPATDAA